MKPNYSYIIISTCVVISILLYACTPKTYQQGKKLYETHCSSCHQANGEGLAKLYPPLKGSDYWMEHQENLACIIRYGLYDTITVNNITYNAGMRGIKELSNAEISNIINYINTEWYEDLQPWDAKQLNSQLKACKNVIK